MTDCMTDSKGKKFYLLLRTLYTILVNAEKVDKMTPQKKESMVDGVFLWVLMEYFEEDESGIWDLWGDQEGNKGKLNFIDEAYGCSDDEVSHMVAKFALLEMAVTKFRNTEFEELYL
jgi:hypothetical protein